MYICSIYCSHLGYVSNIYMTFVGHQAVSWASSASTEDLLRFSSTRRSPGRTLVVSVVFVSHTKRFPDQHFYVLDSVHTYIYIYIYIFVYLHLHIYIYVYV